MKKTSKKGLIIGCAIGVALLAVIIGVIFYNSPSSKAMRQLKLGEKYLEEMNYEEAVVAFCKALELDPNNEKILAAVNECINNMYDVAVTHGKAGEYDAERKMATYILEIDPVNIRGRLALADSELGDGNTDEARNIYDDILDEDPENEDALTGKHKCEVLEMFKGYELSEILPLEDAILLKEILDLCKDEKWEDVANQMNGESAAGLKAYLDENQTFTCLGESNLVVGKKDNGYYVYSGDYKDSVMAGSGVGVVVGQNINTIYKGEWASNVPNGNGEMNVWKKGTSVAEGQVYTANFSEGLVDGEVTIVVGINGTPTTIMTQAEKGALYAYKTDENGNVWLLEELSESGCAYVANYVKESNGRIVDYLAGVLGFGGEDKMVDISLLDGEAPVFKCSLKPNIYYENSDYSKPDLMRGISATDNVDGDLTDKIVIDTSVIPNSWNGQQVGVTYTVVDAAGNKAEMIVYYVLWSCGDMYDYEYVSSKK